MNRLWQLAVTLVGALTLAMSPAYVASISHSWADPVLLLFTDPDGTVCHRPCLFGVRPGETTYEAALVVLRAHPLTRDFTREGKDGSLRGPEAHIILHFQRGKPVSQIDLVRTVTGRQMIWGTLGRVVAGLSAPDWTSINSDFTVSYYVADHVVFHHSHHAANRIGVDDRLEQVAVFEELPRIPPGATPWLGLNAIRRYLPGAGPVHLRTGIMFELTPRCSPRTICRSDQ